MSSSPNSASSRSTAGSAAASGSTAGENNNPGQNNNNGNAVFQLHGNRVTATELLDSFLYPYMGMKILTGQAEKEQVLRWADAMKAQLDPDFERRLAEARAEGKLFFEDNNDNAVQLQRRGVDRALFVPLFKHTHLTDQTKQEEIMRRADDWKAQLDSDFDRHLGEALEEHRRRQEADRQNPLPDSDLAFVMEALFQRMGAIIARDRAATDLAQQVFDEQDADLRDIAELGGEIRELRAEVKAKTDELRDRFILRNIRHRLLKEKWDEVGFNTAAVGGAGGDDDDDDRDERHMDEAQAEQERRAQEETEVEAEAQALLDTQGQEEQDDKLISLAWMAELHVETKTLRAKVERLLEELADVRGDAGTAAAADVVAGLLASVDELRARFEIRGDAGTAAAGGGGDDADDRKE